MAGNKDKKPEERKIDPELVKKFPDIDLKHIQGITDTLEGIKAMEEKIAEKKKKGGYQEPPIDYVAPPGFVAPPSFFMTKAKKENFRKELQELMRMAVSRRNDIITQSRYQNWASDFFDRYRPLLSDSEEANKKLERTIADQRRMIDVLKSGKIHYTSNLRTGFIKVDEIAQVEYDIGTLKIIILLKNGLREEFDHVQFWWLYELLREV